MLIGCDKLWRVAIIAMALALAAACADKHTRSYRRLREAKLKKVVAVADFKMEKVRYGPDVAHNLGDMLVDKLVGTGKFIVVERDREAIDLALDRAAEREQAARQSGRSVGSGAQAGRALAAQALFVGAVTGVGKGSTVGGGGAGWGGGGFGAGGMGVSSDRVSVAIRWYDTTSLEILNSHECSKTRASLGFLGAGMGGGGIGAGGGVLRSTLHKTFSRALDRCVRWIVREMDSIPWEGRIVKTSDDDVYINAGSDIGVIAGLKFEVFSAGEDLIDPVTGAILGVEEAPSGEIEVTEVKPSYSVAKATSGLGFKAGDIVRPIKP